MMSRYSDFNLKIHITIFFIKSTNIFLTLSFYYKIYNSIKDSISIIR